MSAHEALPWVAVGLLTIGLAGGGLVDVRPARPEVHRAGYRVLETDLHVHTRFSDGFLSPVEVVDLGARRGLDAIAVTEHNVIFPAELARRAAAWVPGAPIVIVGEEVTTWRYHVLALGLTRAVDARAPLAAVIDDAHAQGAVVIAAHPTKRYWKGLAAECARFDGYERMHPLVYRTQSVLGRWDEVPRFESELCEGRPGLAAIGSSDYHVGSILGLFRTQVFVSTPTEAGIVEAVRAGRTVVTDLDGSLHGPPDLVAALTRDPIPPRDSDHAYRGLGTLDVVGRTFGFIGLALLFAFGLPRRARRET